MPELLRQRPLVAQVLMPTLVPAAFGAICGWLLAIGGGYAAGLEHDGWREGAIRGLVGGALFGAFILIVNEATGKSPKADLPHPHILLVVLTAVFGTALGALGGRRRGAIIEAG